VRALQTVCERFDCAIAHGRGLQEKARRAADRKRREGLLTVNDHHKLTQREFNAYIRLRDACSNLPCVSCGRFHQGQWHAGHYRTTKAQPALRYNELNCWRQCAPCNNHKSGNITEYRIELIRRIGVELVEWLEREYPAPKWTIEELKALREYYKNAQRAMMTTPGECEPF
jgi:hypothetical protein